MAKSKKTKRKKISNYEPLLLFIGIVAILGFGSFVFLNWWRGRSILDEPPPRIFFNSFGIHIPPNYEIHGIDVSKYQGAINWDLVKNMKDGGIKLGFVFMKATEGESQIDRRFARNWTNAKKAKIIRGAYHFFNPYKSGTDQAKHFISQVKLEKGDMPPVLDVESQGTVSNSELKFRIREFLNKVEQHYKVRPIIYTSVTFYEDRLGSDFDSYPLWVAHYLQFDEPRISRNWSIWQHSEQGQVSGIKGKVDFNVFNGDSLAFRALLIPSNLGGTNLGGR